MTAHPDHEGTNKQPVFVPLPYPLWYAALLLCLIGGITFAIGTLPADYDPHRDGGTLIVRLVAMWIVPWIVLPLGKHLYIKIASNREAHLQIPRKARWSRWTW